MPLYMDIHVVAGATAAALEEAHKADLAVQHKHCVNCIKYWLNEEARQGLLPDRCAQSGSGGGASTEKRMA